MDALSEVYEEEKDTEILEDMKKKKKKKSFGELINQKEVNSLELDEAMLEA